MERVYRPRPTIPVGPDTSAAVGRFVDGHPGRSIVTVRGGDLVLGFQPLQFVHAQTTPYGDVGFVATVASSGAAPDRLLASGPGGLTLLRYGASGFVPVAGAHPLIRTTSVQTLKNVAPSAMTSSGFWPGIDGLGVQPAAQNGSFRVLGWSGSAVRVASLDWAGTVSNEVPIPVPLGETVFEATFVDWLAGGEPELAVLRSDGLFVYSTSGAELGSVPDVLSAGRLVARMDGGAQQIVTLVEEGSDWRVRTFAPSRSGVQEFDGGTVGLASAPIGLGVVDLFDDGHQDLVVSTAASTRTILLGGPLGIVASPSTDIGFEDLGPGFPPSRVFSNLVPALIDDLDRDGHIDLAILHAETDQLVLFSDLGAQLSPSTASLDGVSGTFELVASLGIETAPNFAATPVGWSQPMAGVDMLGVRLQLPEQVPTDLFRVVVYKVGESGQPPSSDSGTDLRAWNVFWFSAPDAAPGGLLDLMIPIPDATDLMGGFSVGRLTIEVSMVTPIEQPGVASPLLLDYAVQSGVTWADLMNLISSFAQLILPIDSTVFDSSEWFEGTTPPGDPIPDTRYFGAIITVMSHEALTNPPTMPPPLVMNTGVGH